MARLPLHGRGVDILRVQRVARKLKVLPYRLCGVSTEICSSSLIAILASSDVT